ncbi:DUF2304 domain-containing protein [Mycoplasmatota bacterium]|nr:DUF2304 domain-containing protein [Mycoplasmatota bacterium]
MYISIDTLVVGIITFVLIMIMIRASKFRIKDAVFWILWTIALSIFAFVPAVSSWTQSLIGIKDPSIFLFILIVSFSYFLMFNHSAILSQHEDKIKELSQIIAIQQLEQKRLNKDLLEAIKVKNEH